MLTQSLGLTVQGRSQLITTTAEVINPFKDQIISWLNLLTDTVDTVYDGKTPTNSDIEAYADTINGQII